MLAYPPEVAVTSYLAFANVVLVPDMYGAEPEKVEPLVAVVVPVGFALIVTG